MLRLHVEETRCVGHSHMSDNQTWLVGETAFYADQHADRTAQGKDGDTNEHSCVAAISYQVGPQSKAIEPLV